MANYKGHVVGGIVASAIYAGAIMLVPLPQLHAAASLTQEWQIFVAIVVIGALFGIFPDVDTNSKAQDIFFGIAFPLDIILIASKNLAAAAYLGLVAMLPIIGHHRGWTHKKWAMVAVPLPILIVPYLYQQQMQSLFLVLYGAAVIGYASHLLLDGLLFKRFRIKN